MSVKGWETVKRFFESEGPQYVNTFDVEYFASKYPIHSMRVSVEDRLVTYWIDGEHYLSFRYSWNEPKIYVLWHDTTSPALCIGNDAVERAILIYMDYLKAKKALQFFCEQ